MAKRGKFLTFPLPHTKQSTGRHTAKDWDGSYGSGAGRAHYCVGFVACPQCGVKRGYLCLGGIGPHFETHVLRRNAYTKLKREFRANQRMLERMSAVTVRYIS